jgi:hypothetical protein
MGRGRIRSLLFGLLLGSLALAARADRILFDASKREMAGNADWVIDADAWNYNIPAYPCTGNTNESNPAQAPSPAQSGIGPSSPETYWTGGISAWAVDLVKAGHTVETLPPGSTITSGLLSNYDLFIVCEPQNPFSADEKAAILAFVSAGGGLFMVGDHETSDRDCDTWDSPAVWNDLTGATSASSAGVFGIWFRVDGSSTKPSEDWFDDGVDSNVETDPADPIINGPFGSGAGGLGLFGATSMDLNPADNPTVKAHVWRTGQAHDNLRVTFATASYGSGRVAAIGDSSPADDDTGDPGDTLYPGWDKASGGVNNREIHLNACHWLLNPAPDVTDPVITSGPAASASDCSAAITWETDEPATSLVEYGLTPAYGSSASVSGYTRSHSVTLAGLAPGTTYHYRVSSTDAAGNGPATSADATFSTAAASAPVITSGPSATSVSGTSATIAWGTDEPATSQVEYGLTPAYGSSASVSGYAASHSVPLAGLTPETTYHYRVLSTDACGSGPTASTDGTLTTGPASLDVSGWVLKQFNSTLTYTIPAGTTIPSGGYLVVARNATRSQFEAFYAGLGHPMPAGTIFLNSNASGSCANGCLPQVNGGETFELWDTAAKVEGPTRAMSEENAYQRISPCGAPGSDGSWTTVPEANANPGQGAGTPCGAGVVINEIADASDYTKEFVELYYDAGSAPADTVPPAAITDLAVVPLSDTSVQLTWTASGDDGTTGTAAKYAIKRSSNRILTEADFENAILVTDSKSALPPGSAEQQPVTGLSADTSYYFALKVSDEVPNTSGLSTCAWGTTAPTGGGGPATDHLVISQVQVAGDGSDPANDEFVEFYNPTGAAVSLSGWSLQYKSATGANWVTPPFSLSGSVPSHGYFLVIRQTAYNGGVAGDVQWTQGLGGSGGNLAIVSNATTLGSSCTGSNLVDRVAWGSGNCPEGSAVSAPSVNNSIQRKPGGTAGAGQDTDDNSADFIQSSPSVPHNSSSALATPPSSLGNVRATLFVEGEVSGAELRWGSAAGATGYRVYRGTTGNFMSGSPAPWQTVTATNHLDATVPSPVLYYVIRATDGTNESPD